LLHEIQKENIADEGKDLYIELYEAWLRFVRDNVNAPLLKNKIILQELTVKV